MLAARNELVDNVRVDDVDLIGKDAHQQAAQLRPVQLTIAIQVEFPVIRADVVRYALAVKSSDGTCSQTDSQSEVRSAMGLCECQ